jgi:hypothetical protein
LKRRVREEVERREREWEDRDQERELGTVDRNEWTESIENPEEVALEGEVEEMEINAQW